MTGRHERRFCRLSLRVSQHERSAIETAATRAGFCLSDYLRRIVLAAKPLRARRRPPVELHLAAQLLVQLGAIASELRTIARQTRAALSPVIERQLGRILHELQRCRITLLRALGRKGRAP
jgi:uncharacterized protein (DUF1778 family)